MYREITNDIPMKLVTPSSTVAARTQLFKYAETVKKMIASRYVASYIYYCMFYYNMSDEIYIFPAYIKDMFLHELHM